MVGNPIIKKCLAVGIILLFVGIRSIPNTCGNIDEKNNCFELNEPRSVNETIIDYIGDVCSVNYTTQETTIVTCHPDIEVANLDITQATYSQQGVLITLSVQVAGHIEDRGHLINLYNETDLKFNFVEYDFQVTTSEQDYTICYANQTGQLHYDNGTFNLTSSAFLVVGNTLSIWFFLMSAGEIYESMSATSMFVKMNLSSPDPNPSGFVYLSDLAPNPPLEIMWVHAPDMGFVGETIQFNGSVEPFTGLPPYVYEWHFGDQGISTEKDPTHIYTKAGNYLYTFIVTDNAGAIAYASRGITIYELKKTFIFGRYTNWTTEDGLTTIDAARIRTLQFKPFKLEIRIPVDTIKFSDDWVGFRTKQFIVGIFEVVIENHLTKNLEP